MNSINNGRDFFLVKNNKLKVQTDQNHYTHKQIEVFALDSCSPNWSSFCWSGVLSGSVEAISSLIFPISVCTPVATTTPMARPAAMLVPWSKVKMGIISMLHHQTFTQTECVCVRSYVKQSKSYLRHKNTIFFLSFKSKFYGQFVNTNSVQEYPDATSTTCRSAACQGDGAK